MKAIALERLLVKAIALEPLAVGCWVLAIGQPPVYPRSAGVYLKCLPIGLQKRHLGPRDPTKRV